VTYFSDAPQFIIDPTIEDFIKIKRSWFERLFTFPWEPLKAYRVLEIQAMHRIGDNFAVSPATYAELNRKFRSLVAQFELDQFEEMRIHECFNAGLFDERN
jgi:hypothetical protein